MSEDIKKKEEEVVRFFRDAFCADKASIVTNCEDFRITGIVKITKILGEVFYVARVKEKVPYKRNKRLCSMASCCGVCPSHDVIIDTVKGTTKCQKCGTVAIHTGNSIWER
jgi:hypothetical protein